VAVLLVLTACNPPVQGAACRRDDNCPSLQVCGFTCTCEVGGRGGAPQCSGFVRGVKIAIDTEDVSFLDSSTTGDVLIAAGPKNLAELVRREGATWRSGSSVTNDTPALTPAGLDSTGRRVVQRSSLAGVSVRDLVDDTFQVVWFTRAGAVRIEGGEAFASLIGKGLFRKQLGLSENLDGTRLDSRQAEELDVADQVTVIAARFGSDVLTWSGAGPPRTVSTRAQRFSLAALGRTIAVLATDGTVEITRLAGTGLETLDVFDATSLALDGEGTTLATVANGLVSIYRQTSGRWAYDGTVQVSARASAITFSGDGTRLFVALAGQRAIEVHDVRR
jgi:hypothetical protein